MLVRGDSAGFEVVAKQILITATLLGRISLSNLRARMVRDQGLKSYSMVKFLSVMTPRGSILSAPRI